MNLISKLFEAIFITNAAQRLFRDLNKKMKWRMTTSREDFEEKTRHTFTLANSQIHKLWFLPAALFLYKFLLVFAPSEDQEWTFHCPKIQTHYALRILNKAAHNLCHHGGIFFCIPLLRFLNHRLFCRVSFCFCINESKEVTCPIFHAQLQITKTDKKIR